MFKRGHVGRPIFSGFGGRLKEHQKGDHDFSGPPYVDTSNPDCHVTPSNRPPFGQMQGYPRLSGAQRDCCRV